MTIRLLNSGDISQAIEIFKSAYEDMNVPDYEEEYFKKELKASFDSRQIYRPEFWGIEKEGQLVSFAAIANSNFYGSSWEMRWDTTHPDFQKQGLMSKLIEHRISIAIEKSKDAPGVIQVASRRKNTYLKFGFQPIFTRGPKNQATYMVKYINQDKKYK